MFMRNYWHYQGFSISINSFVIYFNHKGEIKIFMWVALFTSTLETKILKLVQLTLECNKKYYKHVLPRKFWKKIWALFHGFMGTTLKFLRSLLDYFVVLLITTIMGGKKVLRMHDSLNLLCCNEPSYSKYFLLCSIAACNLSVLK